MARSQALHTTSRLACAALLLLNLAPGAWAAEPEWVYGVRPGDSLSGIARAYLANPADWPRVQKHNRIINPDMLPPGTKLRIPTALLKREAVAAEVIDLRGEVTRTAVGGGNGEALVKGGRLQVGDTISTAADSTLTLRFVDGSRLLLVPKSSLTLTQMLVLGKTGVVHTLAELNKGSLETKVSQQLPGARYEVKTRALNLAVRGTEFRVHMSETDQVSRNEVVEGGVQAGSAGAPVLVRGGYGTLAAVGQPALAPQALLAPPDLQGVSNRAERLPLNFQWATAAGAQGYHAQIFADKNFEKLVKDTVVASNSAQISDLPDGSYYLRVRGIDRHGLEGMNAEREFTLKARPVPPPLVGPLTSDLVSYGSNGSDLVMRWNEAADAQGYHLQLSAHADFSQTLLDIPKLAKNEHVLPMPPGKYYWRVASINATQEHGPFSEVQTFVHRKMPIVPQTQAAKLEGKQIALRWSAGEPDTQYRVQLASDKQFSKPVSDLVVSDTQARLDLPAPGTYFVRVRAIEIGGYVGPYSPAQQIDVPAVSVR